MEREITSLIERLLLLQTRTLACSLHPICPPYSSHCSSVPVIKPVISCRRPSRGVGVLRNSHRLNRSISLAAFFHSVGNLPPCSRYPLRNALSNTGGCR